MIEDDVYDGQLIPVRSTVIGNTYTILHDPEFFLIQKAFQPEWFSDPERAEYLLDDLFGFGSRVCPGGAYGAHVGLDCCREDTCQIQLFSSLRHRRKRDTCARGVFGWLCLVSFSGSLQK